jgi:predicted  nucleic acid-binding Zn-ribbon protein
MRKQIANLFMDLRKDIIMEKSLTPKLKSLKEEFDFLHKKIGELEWELATVFYGRKAVTSTEIETVEAQLDNYRDNMGILMGKIKAAVSEANHQ